LQRAAEARLRPPYCRPAGAAQTLKAVVERDGDAEGSAAAPEPPPTDKNSLLTDALMLAPAVDVMAMVLGAAWPLLNRQNKHAAAVKLRRLCALLAGPWRPLWPLFECAEPSIAGSRAPCSPMHHGPAPTRRAPLALPPS